MRRIVLFLLLLLLSIAWSGPLSPNPAGATESEEAPEGVQMLLPRNGIPAVFEPEFVPASESTLPEDEWIFGVVVEGEARAYSLTLLNHHEIVNDRVGEHPFAAVW